MKTFLHNHPTKVALLSQQYDNYLIDNENTRAKMVLRLRDPKFLLLVVGLAQIMEIYYEVPFEGHQSIHFPSQVWER